MLDVMDIMSSVSQHFQREGLLVNDVVDKLETATLRLEELKLCPGKSYGKFLKNLDATTGVLPCGKDGGQQVTLTCRTN